MSVYKLGIAILFALPIELVSSAPSLNKSPKGSSNLMIAANDDILSKEVSGTSNHSLNSTRNLKLVIVFITYIKYCKLCGRLGFPNKQQNKSSV